MTWRHYELLWRVRHSTPEPLVGRIYLDFHKALDKPQTRIQPLAVVQKRAIRICNHLEYKSNTKPAFLKLKTLTIADLFKFKFMALMYNMPSNILSYLCMVHMTHYHDRGLLVKQVTLKICTVELC